MKGYSIRFLGLLALIALATSMMPANASGITFTGQTPANGEIDAASVGVDGYATTTISWTGSAIYVNGQHVQLVLSPTPSSSHNILPCSPDPSTIGTITPTWGPATDHTVTFTVAGTPSSATNSLCIRVPVTSVGGLLAASNFSVAAITTGATVDYGATLFYINGGNDVNVTASVPSTLSFQIFDPFLETEQYNCALGTLTTAAVNQCAYRLRVATNASLGFTAKIHSNQKLANDTHTATITNIGAGGTITAGTEGYGIAVTGATTGGRNNTTGLYDQPLTVAGAFTPNDNPVPQSQETILSYTSGFVSTSTAQSTLVTHKAAINGATPAGAYSQKVTYYVTGSF